MDVIPGATYASLACSGALPSNTTFPFNLSENDEINRRYYFKLIDKLTAFLFKSNR